MWKLKSTRVSEPGTSFETESVPSIGHSHSFRPRVKGSNLCSTATDLKEKWGHKYRPIAHASRNRKSCRTAFFFFICSSLNVVRIFKKWIHPDSCCCIIKGSVRHGKQAEHCPVVWSFTINSIYTFSCH